MDLGTWVSITGTAISLGAAGIASWQAVVAKDQARTAQDSADSARRQADAAEQQVLIMLRQVEGEERDRQDAEKPEFTVEHGEIANDPYGQPRVGVRITQRGGVALSKLKLTVSGQYVQGIRPEPDEYFAVAATGLGASADGAVHRLWIGLEHEHVSPATITVQVESNARDSKASWTHDLVLSADWPPSPQTLKSRRIGSFKAFTP